MFKQFMTLLRGQTTDLGQGVLDANAVTLLRQQMRDAAHAVEQSRKSVAVVMAYAEREKAALAALDAQIADLEGRARAALAQNDSALALEAAETIATLEDDRAALHRTLSVYDAEIATLKTALKQAEGLLVELQRGQRLAEATDRTQRLRGGAASPVPTDLTAAAQTLARLQDRQKHADATLAAMASLTADRSPEALSDRLAAAGYGAPKRTAAAQVLERLQQTAA